METVAESETDGQVYYQELKDFLELESKRSAQDISEWATKKWGGDRAKCLAKIQTRASHYCLLDGVLHHGKENPKPVVMKKSEQQKILQDLHVQEQTGIHNGVSKMYSALCATYFWRGQYGDVKNFVRTCGYCIELPPNAKEYPPILKSPREIGTSITSSKPTVISKDSPLEKSKKSFESEAWCEVMDFNEDNGVWRKVEINMLGPYQLKGKNKRFLAVLVDPVSHWLSAQTFSMDDDFDQLSEDVSRFVFTTFCTLGFPSVLSLVEGCRLKRDILFSNLETMMKRIKFSAMQSNGKVTTKDNNSAVPDNNHPTLLSLTGITLVMEAKVSLPIELNTTSASSCVWAWRLMENYVNENEDTWDVDLDIFLFEQRRKKTISSNRCPFYHIHGRKAFNGDNLCLDKELKSKRRKLKSSVFECRHCQESFTSKISFHIHQKKHTEEAQLRGLIDDDTNDESSRLSSTELQQTESCSSKLPSSDSNTEPMEEVSVSTSNACQKSMHHRLSATSHRRKPHLKTACGKKPYQRGITRLLNLAQIRSLAAKGVNDEIPKDSCRANFTAQTVASVRASLEAKRKKRISRGNYQRYSPELREEIAKYAITHGTQQAVQHFSSKLGGKPISESTVRNFIKAQCSPTTHHNCFRNQGLEEEIGRFSAVAGTEAAIRCFSSRLGREVKRGTVSRLRRAYINKHPEDAAISKNFSKKKCDSAKRKRRFGAMLRDEIGSYAAQHGVTAAVQHFSERLLFPVRVFTVEKFLKLHTEKKASKNNLVPVDAAPDLMEKTSCIPTNVNPSLDILSSSLDVLGGLHQGTGIERLDQGNSVSHLLYNEDGYSGLQHTMHNQQPSSNSLNPINFHNSDVGVYSDEHHSASQIILDQCIPVVSDATNKSRQDSVPSKPSAGVVSLNSQHIILEETLMPVTLQSDGGHKSTHSKTEEIGCDKRMFSEIPLDTHGNCISIEKERAVENFGESDTTVPTSKSNPVEVPEKDVTKGSPEKKKMGQSKKSKKVAQKPKRGTYTFYSPELRARIGRYAAEHGNLQASKYFQAEVGHQIPESTIRGLRDKYVMKQMQVAATAGSGGDCGVVQRQVTALGYAPRGRPMRLGKYDEIVQDCMHELVNSGEKVCSMLAITTARQVLTQYEPSLLEEFGGPIKLNNSWAKSFLKRMGLSNNS